MQGLFVGAGTGRGGITKSGGGGVKEAAQQWRDPEHRDRAND